MANQYAAGKKALGICDRCGFRFLLKKLKGETRKGASVGNLVCVSCFDEDHPQLMVGSRPVSDPQALRNPRPDNGTE